MITYQKFSSIFKGMDFSDGQLRSFYRSVKKTIILRYAGRRSWPEIFRLEETCQWPVLRAIDEPDLTIYRDADPELLENFIASIRREKEIRGRRSSTEKVRYWSSLQEIIDERIGLLTQIFGFCKRDVRRCEAIAARYSRRIDQKTLQRKKLWQIGVGTGAATLAGAAALWYMTQKEKK